jgi:hypothetical protein
LVANSVLYDKKLSLQAIYPYKAFIQLNENYKDDSNNANWCAQRSWLLGLEKAAVTLEQDVQFQELVETLSLNSQLLSV